MDIALHHKPVLDFLVSLMLLQVVRMQINVTNVIMVTIFCYASLC